MSGRPWILGLSTAFHNGAACILHGDEIVVAVQEERLTRVKRAVLKKDGTSLAIDYCLSAAGITLRDLDAVVDCTITTVEGQREAIHGTAITHGLRSDALVLSVPHHLAHAFSAYATSGLAESLVLVIDGGGSFDWQLTAPELAVAISPDDGTCEHLSVYHFSPTEYVPIEKHLAIIRSFVVPKGRGMGAFTTLGHMFSSVSDQIFGEYLEAGKVMGLAPYGRATIPISEFLSYDGALFRFSQEVCNRFPHDDRWPSRRAEYQDLAASVQAALEHALTEFSAKMLRESPSRNLCYAGGVALNSVANHKVLRRAGFKNISIVAAAEDSGPALGAAYFGLSQLEGRIPQRGLRHDFLGRRYSAQECREAVRQAPRVAPVGADDTVVRAAELLVDGAILGWFCGGSEFGPRALGHRSILCDPRRADAKETLNERVKHREEFRPFAAAVLAEHVAEWFELERAEPPMDFMLEVCPFRPGMDSRVPGASHVDGTCRLQTVSVDTDPVFYRLIKAFYDRTGVPMIVNTSLNVHGEPIVETPSEALWALVSTGLDYCYVDGVLVEKDRALRSILELTPRIRPGARLGSRESGEAQVRTPHGRLSYSGLSGLLFDIARAIPGDATGWQIFDRNRSLLGSPAELERVLGLLNRYSIADFAV